LDGKKEQELILIKDDDPQNGFYLMRDIKWDGTTLESLYYQAIVVRRDLKSVR
jgi:m7GpppX diphosphatase